MVKTAAASGKAKAPASAKRTAAKAKTPAKKSSVSGVIGTKKRGASAAAKEKKAAPPLPKGWPAASKLSYPAPRGAKGASPKEDVIDLDSDGADESPQPAGAPANYLRPGNLLQQFCNGSDVFLRKRAVQSTSMTFPSVSAGENGNVVANKGAPQRFLVLFPGRMSLKTPPAKANGASDAKEDGNEEAKAEDGKSDITGDGTGGAESAKKRKAFQPANPPQLLGKLVSVGGAERRMELRIPMPSGGSAVANGETPQQLVMSGRAIPLSGKYMALTFKRTGGSKDASAASTPKNKKRGTGSINCKDVFRSAIVLGESKMVDGAGKPSPLSAAATAGKKSEEDEDKVGAKHYGGSERTLDGGGKAGVSTSRKSLKGATTTTSKRKDSTASLDIDLESDESDDSVTEDTNDSSEAGSDGEFVPTSSRKKKGRASSAGTKRKANDDSDDDEEEVTPARKRTPRRSAAKATNVSYLDESSDMDDDGSSDEEEESDNDDDEEEFMPTAKPRAKKPAAKAKVNSAKPAAKAKKAPASKPRGGFIKTIDIDISDSDGEEEDSDESLKLSDSDDEDEDFMPKPKPKAKKPPAKSATKAVAKPNRVSTTGPKKKSNGSSSTNGKKGSGAKSKPASGKKASEIIEIDGESLDPDEVAKSAKERLAAMMSSPAKSTSSSQKKSPISRGRRKKTSPPPRKSPGKADAFDFDDDDCGFL
ncbi:hypothetical protein ACHAXT_000765 [Thalassiosira profunda]